MKTQSSPAPGRKKVFSSTEDLVRLHLEPRFQGAKKWDDPIHGTPPPPPPPHHHHHIIITAPPSSPPSSSSPNNKQQLPPPPTVSLLHHHHIYSSSSTTIITTSQSLLLLPSSSQGPVAPHHPRPQSFLAPPPLSRRCPRPSSSFLQQAALPRRRVHNKLTKIVHNKK